jgi:hypothetical protein
VGIRNLSPHFRNSAILRTTKSIAELRTKNSYGTAISDLQNLTSAIPQLSCQFRYFLVPFSQLRMFFKINQKYFWSCLFLRKPKTCLKGTIARDFLPPIFFLHKSTGFHGQKYAENCGNEALKLRISEKIAIAELRSCGCGPTFL